MRQIFAAFPECDLALQVVFKAASKSILVALLSHIGQPIGREVRLRPHRHEAIEWMQPDEAVAAGYRRAVFVRNPFDRLVSCYSFFKTANQRQKEIARPFEEWLEWVAENPHRDPHYAPMMHAFRPPAFVGRVESMDQDWQRFGGWLGRDLPAIQHLNTSRHDDYRSFYTDRTRALVDRVYADDLEGFGYGF